MIRVLPVLLALALWACGDDDPVSSQPEGTDNEYAASMKTGISAQEWVLSETVSAGNANASRSEARVTLRFSAAGVVIGNAGCNEYGGDFDITDDGRMSIAQVLNTEMACADGEIMRQETAFLQALNAVTSLSLSDDELELKIGEDGDCLRFVPAADGDPDAPDDPSAPAWNDSTVTDVDLFGSAWRLRHFAGIDGDPTAALEVPKDIEITLELTAAGEASGVAACNLYFGVYEVDATGAVVVREIGITEMFCQTPDIMTWEQRYIEALTQVDAYEIEADRLTLRYGDGSGALYFEAEPGGSDDPGGPEDPDEPVDHPGGTATHDSVWVDDRLVRYDVLPCARDAAIRSEGTRVDLIVDGDDLLFHQELRTHCNALSDGGLAVEVSIEGNHITIDDKFSGPATRCLCTFPIRGSIGDLDPGEYTVDITYTVEADGAVTELLYEAQVTIGDSSRVTPPSGGPLPPDPGTEPEAVPLLIETGTSFGECLGYCSTTLYLDAEYQLIVRSSWDTEQYPELSDRQAMDPDLWSQLVGVADIEPLTRMDEVLGCPDCADGGAEWVALSLSGRREKVTFEYGAEVEPIAPLLSLLRRLRSEALEGMEE